MSFFDKIKDIMSATDEDDDFDDEIDDNSYDDDDEDDFDEDKLTEDASPDSKLVQAEFEVENDMI